MESHASSKQQFSSTRKELFRLEKELSSAEKRKQGLTPRDGDGAVGYGGKMKKGREMVSNRTRWSEEERQRVAQLLGSAGLIVVGSRRS